MSFRYFRSTSGEGTSTALFRCPANGKGVFEQPADAVEVYRPDGTWESGQGGRLKNEAKSGWFVEADDEISVERAMQLMSRISEAARQQGTTPSQPEVRTPPATATKAGPTGPQKTPTQVSPQQPEKKSKPVRRKITIGAVIFVGAWVIFIIHLLFQVHDNDKPIIHPIGMPASSVSVSLEPAEQQVWVRADWPQVRP